ncbi:ferredoxin:protochlorophyllide reductase (ATP-dependent) subunit B [Cyanobium sp. Morenito 9A2]|uniref:ferredoxin:protochlorophyllide reductase (ATP-dependent) subunit B n=1 Tax=Cyanobium sp. Morenito 9A2 TaxID=2823718 RepID=UPI0020CEE959|nr:ferredoxin:protochlorophyllide reductase (ATP-dependent) subunit B [Cyanobium sp. Morenito 9A2]MCP9849289.1 ferredoxin:protochlorophyllide reductase (ATP-dependent) subunit B [Cyanobium sp. Morenito 9A2]
MELTLWTYEGPPHVGAMRIATSMEGVHYVLHAPQGDTYADLLFTMIERRGKRPPVTYTTFQARDLGGDTAELVQRSIREAVARFRPEALLVGESCTAELIQDQPGALAAGMNLGVPMVSLELPAYSKKENWGAAETFYQLVRTLLKDQMPPPGTPKPSPSRWRAEGRRPRVNLLGPSLLGFRCRDDVIEITRLLGEHGIDVAVVAPLGARPADLIRLPSADANVCLYPEVAGPACSWLERSFGLPVVRTVPIGIGATADFLRELHAVLDLELPAELQATDGRPSEAERRSRLPWYSRSVDSTYLTGKRVFIFADATHAIAAARIASRELGFQVVGLGSYSREQAREVRAAAAELGLEALITDDYLAVEKAMGEAAAELVLGTQMERHSAKRLGLPCAVISSPLHVQDVPARYAPQMGWEGANVIFDSWVHPLMMGLEEHLIGMFRHDFEFVDGHRSHLGDGAPSMAPAVDQPPPGDAAAPGLEREATTATAVAIQAPPTVAGEPSWMPDGEAELAKIPFFVRGKVRKNTEAFARERGLASIDAETLYDAKAHFSR